MASASTAARRQPVLGVAVPASIFLASCLFYLVNIGFPPVSDELYHVLAARGLLAYGEPRIAEGLYTRVFAYTWLVGQMFAWFGESIAVARLPSVLCMAALNTLLFVWLRKETGWLAASLATGLFALSPFAVEIARFARFYAPQGLLFLVGCIAVYALGRQLPPSRRRLIGYSSVASLCLVAATYLQPTTLLGIAGLGLWLVSVVAVPWLVDKNVARRHKLLAIGAFVALCLLAIGLAAITGLLADFWYRYRATPIFLSPRANEYWFYFVYNLLYYPTLWPLIGLLCFAALAVWPRITWFAMVIFLVGFVLNSFAGPKNLRYISYAQPFLFILFGLGLAAILPWLARAGTVLREQFENHLAGVGFARPTRWARIFLVGALLATLAANGAFFRTGLMLANVAVPPVTKTGQWEATGEVVAPLLDEVDVVVTMVELQTLYFWDRYDILFSPSRLSEMPESSDFDADFRTGRPVISTRESLARVVDCTATGLFAGPADRWGQRQFIDLESVAFIEERMTRLDLPDSYRMVVFTWEHAPPAAVDADCGMIETMLQSADEIF